MFIEITKRGTSEVMLINVNDIREATSDGTGMVLAVKASGEAQSRIIQIEDTLAEFKTRLSTLYVEGA